MVEAVKENLEQSLLASLRRLGQCVERKVQIQSGSNEGLTNGKFKFKLDSLGDETKAGWIEIFFDHKADSQARFRFYVKKEGNRFLQIDVAEEGVIQLRFNGTAVDLTEERGKLILQRIIAEMDSSWVKIEKKDQKELEDERKRLNNALLDQLEKF